MKPIIVDINDLSDSVEVYESKPNRAIIYTIYTIFAILVFAIIWAANFKLDDVVKSNGIFKGSAEIYNISSNVSGKISECKVSDGDLVEEGDVLYIVSIDELSDTIASYENNLKDAEDRLEILDAYEEALNAGSEISEEYKNNQYYEEFTNRRDLLFANIDDNYTGTDGKKKLYKENINTINESIVEYESKVSKLEQVKVCIANRNNSFTEETDGYYSSLVNEYIASYNYSKLQYDNKIKGYQSEIEKLNSQIKTLKDAENVGEESPDESETVDNNEAISQLNSEIEELNKNIQTVSAEENQALLSLEESENSTIEKMIESYNESIVSLKNNLSSAKSELENTSDSVNTKAIMVLTEKGNIASERITYEAKKREYEDYLKNYNLQDENCIIESPYTGYFYLNQDLKEGSFLQEGSVIGSVYPEEESDFYAELYVENQDIGRLKEGQDVKFEIEAYPSSEYGYFTGKIENISKALTVNENTGYAYYLVKVKCDNVNIESKDGSKASLKNGMACTGKIIIGEKTVLKYLLEEINLID